MLGMVSSMDCRSLAGIPGLESGFKAPGAPSMGIALVSVDFRFLEALREKA